MKPFPPLLNEREKGDVAKALDAKGNPRPESAELTANVRSYFDQRLFIRDEAVAKWKALDDLRRSRVLSEIVWRVTCVLDGSETAVIGQSKFSLGYDLAIALIEQDGRDVMVVW